jgi:hypothetical protein
MALPRIVSKQFSNGLHLVLKEDKFWHEKIAEFQGIHFWGPEKPDKRYSVFMTSTIREHSTNFKCFLCNCSPACFGASYTAPMPKCAALYQQMILEAS